jgi:hypothetical protein
MSKNYNFFKFKSFILLVTLLFFSNAFSANWYVNDNSTTGDVYCTAIGNNTNNGTSPATPKLTLGAAITAAAAGDTIFIDTGTYSGTGNINLTVTKANLTFTGAGSLKTVFDNNLASANTNLLLTITANNINISGISATEFNAVSAGKVITVSGQTVVFNDVNFFNNGNNGNGAIYATSGSNVTFANSTTACNASLLFGGGIDLVGNNSVLNISNSVLDATGRAKDKAIALGIGVGSGYLFETDFQKEVYSDLTGERGILMGALAGLFEAQYEVLRKNGHSPSEAFNETVEELTQSLMPLVAENGMDWMFANTSVTAQRGALDWKGKFREATTPVFENLYEEVSSGREANRVISEGSKKDYRQKLELELKEIRESELWQAGAAVRKLRPKLN